jgi:hypothetical protein
VEADYLRLLSESCPLARWQEICQVAVEQALAGDAKAREWLGLYLIGKPTGHALHDEVFAGEIGVFKIDALGGVVHEFDATEELLADLTTTRRYDANGSQS